MEMRNFVAILLWVVSSAQDCGKYTCSKPGITVSADTCAYLNSTSGVWHLQPCEDHYQCGPFNVTQGTATCQAVPTPVEAEVSPGMACSASSQCLLFESLGLGCQGGVCAGKVLGEVCRFPGECNPGLTCTTATCQPQSTGTCFSDFDCTNNYACNNALGEQGTCVSYFSIKTGGSVASCPGPQFNSLSTVPYLNLLCESASCSWEGGAPACIDTLVSAGKLPVPCTSSAQCTADEEDVTSTCGSCGFNQAGSTFCELLPGDSYFSKLLKKTQDWFSSSTVHKCNSAHRWDCMALVWSDFKEWQYYSQATQHYAEVAGAEDCIVSVLFPGLEQAKEQYSAASGVVLGLMVFAY